MKTKLLFPHRWRTLGYVLFIIGIIFFIYSQQADKEIFVWHNFRSTGGSIYNSIDEGFDNEIQLALVTVGLLLIAFAKEKIEDEQIVQLRLESLQWAVYANYAVFMVIIFAAYGLAFFSYAMFNVLTLLLVFIIRFRYTIYKLNKAGKEIDLA